jgi:hypothetical protein
MAIIMYDGSAKDHEVVVEVLKKGKDGKPQKRRIVKPSRNIYKEVEVFNLWGQLFPQGEKFCVTDPDVLQKAAGMGCFEVWARESEFSNTKEKVMKRIKKLGKVHFLKPDEAFPEEAGPPALAPEKERLVLAEDVYDNLKRQDLMRMASTRGMNVRVSLKKAEIIEMLREDDRKVAKEEAQDFVPPGSFYEPGDQSVELR